MVHAYASKIMLQASLFPKKFVLYSKTMVLESQGAATTLFLHQRTWLCSQAGQIKAGSQEIFRNLLLK